MIQIAQMKGVAVVADSRRWRGGRRVLVGLSPLVVLAGCTSSGAAHPPTSAQLSPDVTSASPSAAPSAAKEATLQLAVTGPNVSYLTPVRVTVSDGSFDSVQVAAGGQTLDGVVSGDGSSWASVQPPKPSLSYQVVAGIKDTAGRAQTKTMTFKVASVPNDQRLSFSVTPDDATTVGIGQPIVVRFLSSVNQRSALEKVMHVQASAPSGKAVTGSWHWLSSTEVHWRPQAFWEPGTKVHLDMRIAGVAAAPKRYGRKDYSETFTVGSSHVTRVDGSSHRVRVFRDGKLVNTWPTGTGRPGLETYSGTYIVLGKSPSVQMDSCSARITCDKKDPDYYDEKELWATRITASGTFLHAASWDGLLGRANVSHGCVHLSDTDAQDFYNHAVVGDVVIVNRTGRGPQERIATQDPGLYDWNLPWSQWTAGSALK